MRLRTSWAIVLLLIAALEFLPSYAGAVPSPAFAAAVIVPFGLLRLGIRMRAGATASAALVVVLAVAAGWWALGRSGSTGLATITDALPRLLTTVRPAPARVELLAPALLLVALVATVVAYCVFAPAPAGSARIGGVLAPVVGAAVLYVAAQLLDGGQADRHGLVAVSLLLVTVVSWSTPHWHGSDRAGMAWSPAVVVPAAGVAVVGLLAAFVLPADSPYEPREEVKPPTIRLTEASPLTLLSAWARNPGVEILRASVTGTQRLRLATLSSFSGSAWQVDDSYQDFGAVGSADLPPGARQQPVTAAVTITRLGGLWVPSPGGTTATSLGGAVVDPSDGGLARPDPVAAGLTYSVNGSVDSPTQSTLRAASLADAVPKQYLATPRLPSGFAQYARDSIRGASSPLEEAVALESAVSTGRSLQPDAPTGTSYARLATFLFDTSSRAGARRGTSEQFAAAFAVLARVVGLPTRVVVGFVVPKAGADDRSVVRGANAEAWPEVYLAGAGWVPFEPTPGTGGTSGDAGLKQSVLARLKGNAAIVTPPSRSPVATPSSAAPTSSAAVASGHGASTSALLVTAAAVAVLLLVLALLAGLRAARTARHRRRGARGAWAEVLDLLVLLGRPAPNHLAAPEIAASLDRRLGRPGGAELVAAAADRAAFAPRAPGVSDAGGPGESPEVWRQVRVLRRRARRTMRWYRRAGFPLDPRPLLRRR